MKKMLLYKEKLSCIHRDILEIRKECIMCFLRSETKKKLESIIKIRFALQICLQSRHEFIGRMIYGGGVTVPSL